jgi:hypothetical protein
MATVFEQLEAYGWLERVQGPYQKAPLNPAGPGLDVLRSPKPSRRTRWRASQQPRPCMILEKLGVADVTAKRIDRPMAADIHHFKN